MSEPAGKIKVEEQIDSNDELNVPLLPPKKKSPNNVPKWKKSEKERLDENFPSYKIVFTAR